MSDTHIKIEDVDLVTIRFAGDSGDGMQLTGGEFTNNSAFYGNDISTFPDFPAEIRAPAGSLFGVSSFQLQFSSQEIHTPGDMLDVLVAMNPAALKVHLPDLKDNGLLITNTFNYSKKNLTLAGYDEDPTQKNDIIDRYRLVQVDMTGLVNKALEDTELTAKIKARCSNMFALGLLYWLYNRDFDTTLSFLNSKFKTKPDIVNANTKALKAGYYYGETIEAVRTTYRVPKAKFGKGIYRNILGNHAISLGLLAASEKSGRKLFFGGYPITPASDILHDLAKFKNYNVKTFQAEDEIAGVCSAIGAAYAGDLAVTASSGPGIALKGEALGLAVMTELPLVIFNIQRGGPSTGLPTKTEQADLLQAMYGRNSEAPLVVIAAESPSDCFNTAFEAAKIALEHMIPVMVLSDGYIANGSEPWKFPKMSDLDSITPVFADNPDSYQPYGRNNKTLARQWAIPGMKGFEHRIGGLEKQDITGNVNYEPDNHHHMVQLRQERVDRIADFIDPAIPYGENKGDLLVLGWGSTYGAIRSAVKRAMAEGLSVSHVHLRYINPFPKNIEELLSNYSKVLIPEINLGQLSMIIRSKFLIDTINMNQVSGKSFIPSQILSKIKNILEVD